MFLDLYATPCVERVVDDHSVAEHFVVIPEVGREAVGDREQALALRSKITS